jgi:tripartite-type tricarboxylate transporter receptor subunit TctC
MWAHLRAAALVLLCAWPGGWLVSAAAQNYPAKPIRLVVPFPPGGPNDVIGRVVGQKMQDLLGQSVIRQPRRRRRCARHRFRRKVRS